MIDVFYYYFFLFYAKVMPNDYPHSNTTWALGVMFSFIINGLLEIGTTYFFGYALEIFQTVIITVLVMIFFYLKYSKSGRGKRIVEIEKPKFFGSKRVSIVITILFFLISMLFLFFSADVVRKILEIEEL